MIDPFKELDQRPAEFEIGATVFGCFQIIDKLGAGAMGVVYKVRNTMLDKLMALKVLPKDYVSEADFLRFQNEARALSKLDHPNIARVYDFGLDGRTPYLSMDLANGPTLQSVLADRKTLPLLECLDLCMQMCDGLEHAHEKNVVHRDIKPGNIILAQESDSTRVKIVDFGVAKLERPEDAALTQTGAFIGSPLYASPEQAQGKKATARSDMYSFGCVMFQCLTGEAPFHGDTVLETLLKHSHEAPPIDRLKNFPESVQKIMQRLLAKEPEQRYASMGQVRDELKKVDQELDSIFAEPQQDSPSEDSHAKKSLLTPLNIALAAFAVAAISVVLVLVLKESSKSDQFKIADSNVRTAELLMEDARLGGNIDRKLIVVEKKAKSEVEKLISKGEDEALLEDWEAAYNTFKECRKRIDELKTENDKLDLLRRLLISAHKTQRSEEEKEITAEMLKHKMDDIQSTQLVELIGANALDLRVSGNKAAAVREMKNCIKLFENSGNGKNRGVAVCMARAGTWEMESGHWSEAKSLVDRSLKIFVDHHIEPAPDPEYCFALIYAGNMKHHERDFAAARQYYKRAYEPLAGREGEFGCAATVVNMFISLAAMDAKEGKKKEAREALEQADRIARYNHLDDSIRALIKSKISKLGNKN